MDASWQQLGDAAGATTVGLNLVKVAPGRLPTPPHSHGASEELFFVLAGDGLAWQDDARPRGAARRLRDPPADELEHTFVAGGDGPRVPGVRHSASDRDRLAAALAGDPFRLAVGRGAGRRSVGRGGAVAAAGGGRAGRPATEHPERRRGGARGAAAACAACWRPASAAAGRPALGAAGAGPNRIAAALHSEEEELFVILDGIATLQLWPSPVAETRGVAREDIEMRAGHVVARPPGSGSPTRSRPGRGRDDADLRHPQAQRHGLVPAVAARSTGAAWA